jgi:MFS superfamily sulfate permease-like transporter
MGLVDVPEPPRWLILDADAIDDIDYTGGKTLAELADVLRQCQIVFAIVDAADTLRDTLDRFGVTDKIGAHRYYDSLEAAREAFRNI